MASADTYYRFETNGNCSVITLLPELNDRQWADIDRCATELEERLNQIANPRLLLDLTPLSYMGSAMVALNVRLFKSVNARGGKMVVVNQHDLVHEVLKLAGLTKLWTIVDSREKGLTALGMKSRPVPAGGTSPPTMGNGVLLAGVIGTVGALVGLALQLAMSNTVSPKISQLIEVGFAAVGFIGGTMILVNQTGTRRNIGIAILAICLLVILGGIVANNPQERKANSGPAATGSAAPPVPTPIQTTATTSAAVSPAVASPAAAGNGTATAVQTTSAGNAKVGGGRKKKDKD